MTTNNVSIVRDCLNAATKKWDGARLKDPNLEEAWNNIYHMMFRGKLESIFAGIELLCNMQWVDALAKFVIVSDEGLIEISHQIPKEDRPIYALAILGCHHRCQNEMNWLSTIFEMVNWNRMSILAGSVDCLHQIPEWLEDFLLPACLEMVTMPSGRYRMGPPENQRWNQVEGFDIAVIPVTQFLFEYMTGENPSSCIGWMNPVDNITWFDALQFCNMLSEQVGLQPAYDLQDPDNITMHATANGFRLPSRIEWEASARYQQSLNEYSGGTHMWDVGVCTSDASEAVARYTPNPLGLYDMSGNIWEWCWDHDSHYAERCGGSWMSMEEACQVWFQSKRFKTFVSSTQGFRLVMPTPIEEEEQNNPPTTDGNPSDHEEESWDTWRW